MKILIFGESVAWGAFDIEKGGWVERLKTHHLNNYVEREIGVYNFAVSGNTSKGILKFLRQDIEKLNFIEQEEQVHIFAIGTNDSTREGRIDANFWVSVEEYKNNIEQIISISRQFATQTIFIGDFEVDETLTLPWNNTNLYWKNEDGAMFESELIKICKLHNIEFISTKDCVTLDDLSDGVHPNPRGHEKIFNTINDYLEKNIL